MYKHGIQCNTKEHITTMTNGQSKYKNIVQRIQHITFIHCTYQYVVLKTSVRLPSLTVIEMVS